MPSFGNWCGGGRGGAVCTVSVEREGARAIVLLLLDHHHNGYLHNHHDDNHHHLRVVVQLVHRTLRGRVL